MCKLCIETNKYIYNNFSSYDWTTDVARADKEKRRNVKNAQYVFLSACVMLTIRLQQGGLPIKACQNWLDIGVVKNEQNQLVCTCRNFHPDTQCLECSGKGEVTCGDCRGQGAILEDDMNGYYDGCTGCGGGGWGSWAGDPKTDCHAYIAGSGKVRCEGCRGHGCTASVHGLKVGDDAEARRYARRSWNGEGVGGAWYPATIHELREENMSDFDKRYRNAGNTCVVWKDNNTYGWVSPKDVRIRKQ